MERLDILIQQNEITQQFKQHLDDVTNNRILFSAPFGAGKSTFLKDFFEQQNNGDSYNYFFLNPVNYSVAPNQDIFELIKFDIIDHLLRKYGSEFVETNDINSLYILQAYIKNEVDFFHIVTNLIKAIPGVSETSDLISSIKEQADGFFKYKDEITKSKADRFEDFLKSFSNRPGSIYENDSITALIQDYIARLKEKTGRQLVLIIDDLDRLDPEHLFRILNVFSSHYNQDYTKNKFEIDKIIVVCDIKNVRQIFSSRYGAEVEFSGYIDKFYSKDIFYFDNRSSVQLFLRKKFESFTYSVNSDQMNLYGSFNWDNSLFFLALEDIVSDLVEFKSLVLRNFSKVTDFKIDYSEIYIKDVKYYAASFEFFPIVQFLRGFFPAIEDLINALKILAESFSIDPTTSFKPVYRLNKTELQINRLITVALRPMLALYRKTGSEGSEKNIRITYNGKLTQVTYTQETEWNGGLDKIALRELRSGGEGIKPNPYLFFIKAIQDFQREGIIK